MKTYAVVLLTGLLFSTAFLSQSTQESPELKEATELTERATKLLNEGKADEAIPLAKRALQIREKLLPPTDLKISRRRGKRGQCNRYVSGAAVSNRGCS